MQHREHRRGMTLALAFVAALGAAGPVAADPNIFNVRDILDHRRYLMRIDDLVVVNLPIRNGHPEAEVDFAYTLRSKVHEVAAAGSFGALGNPNPAYASAVSQADETAPQALGRMFNLPRDVVVSLLLEPAGVWRFIVDDPAAGAVSEVVTTSIFPAAQGRSAQAVVMADLDGDGYLEAVIAYLGQDAHGQPTEALRIVKAVDPSDILKGLQFGPELLFQGPLGLFAAPLSTLRTGDVNGDGQPEILGFNGTALSVAAVDPTTLAISVATRVSLPSGESMSTFNMIAGRFRPTSSCSTCEDVLVIGQRHGDTAKRLTRYAFGLDPALPRNLDIKFYTRAVSGSRPESIVHVFLSKGPLRDFANGRDLVVVGVAELRKSSVEILESDPNLDFKLVSVTTASQKVANGQGCLYGLAVGNFDDRTKSDEHAVTLQIATLWRQISPGVVTEVTCSNAAVVVLDLGLRPLGVRLWSITPTTTHKPGNANPDWLSIVSESEVLAPIGQASSFASLHVGDLQGRSLVLGAPEKVTIFGHIQPDLVLGIPPMHIDWINPEIKPDPAEYPDCTTLAPKPCQLNVSVLPSVLKPGVGFSSQYSFSEESSGSSDRKTTTSWSLGVKVTADNKVSWGVPKVDDTSVDVKASAGYTHDHSVATERNTYHSLSESMSATTGFADFIFYTQKVQHIFYYPVIGRTTCEKGTFECLEPAQKKPLYVSFSAPDSVQYVSGDASTIEWYQPAHEPGNVLSYPWSLDQLQQSFTTVGSGTPTGSLTPLTEAQTWGSDSADLTLKAAWSNSSGLSKSTGSVNAESSSLSVTISANATYSGVRDAASLEVDVNQSLNVTTHNASTQKVSESFGLQVNKPPLPSASGSTYLYNFSAYVFGTKHVEATPQDNLVPTDDAGKPADITTTGPMLMAYVAQPNAPWWQQVYGARPDVALNHPRRWAWSVTTRRAAFNASDPHAPVADQDFYLMRGLFITPANANGAGPTRASTTAGETMRLTARVHNYSLVDTSAHAAVVRARFYGQKWSVTAGDVDGPAFLIGETQIPSIPAFGGSEPNWVLTSVDLDTTPYSDQSLIFWIVVWMEDAQGALVAEVPDHGLTQIPPPGLDQITDVSIQSHSNNVGLYGAHMPFQVLPPNVEGAGAAMPGQLAVEDVSVPDPPIVVDRRARITAMIRAVGGDMDGVPVAFYDGDPAQGGRLFYFQVIPRLSPDRPHKMRAFFQPLICGTHRIVVVAGHETTGRATADATVDVIADPANGEGCPRALTALGPVKVWIGLRNSDDVGTSFDLRADAYLGSDLVGSGQVNGVAGGSGFNNARLATVPLSFHQPVEAPGAHLRLELSARIACSGRTHTSGAARLWFNDAQANSRVGVTVDGLAKDYYLRSGAALAATPGSGPKTTVDVSLDSKSPCSARPFEPFGAWSITLP